MQVTVSLSAQLTAPLNINGNKYELLWKKDAKERFMSKAEFEARYPEAKINNQKEQQN